MKETEWAREGRGIEEGKRPLVILAGPTAVGKTALSVALARRVDGEIVSADSMQVYRKMDIGTAKATMAERAGIPHHLIDILDPSEDFSAAQFQKLAKEAIGGIYARGRIPIVVGGTGFYIQALLRDVDFEETGPDDGYRKELERVAREEGPGALHEMLREVDEEAARLIHANNQKRVIRALEFYRQTGERISDHNARERERESPYRFAYFVLCEDRKVLYERIDRRVDEMMEKGLLREVESLLAQGYGSGHTSMQGLGYKELLPYLRGERSLEESIAILKRDTRHFAKRQITWFKRERDAIWVDRGSFPDEEALLEFLLRALRERGIWG